MKVYIVMRCSSDASSAEYIAEVFDAMEKAEKYIKIEGGVSNRRYYSEDDYEYYEIHTYEVM